jgi:hypothetical protein
MTATNPIDVAWLAGLLEGEGSFFVQKRPDRRRDQARVYLAMTDEDVVRRAASLMGAPSVQRRVRREDHWKDQYVAVVTGSKATAVMRSILPHLGERRAARVREILSADLSHAAQQGVM